MYKLSNAILIILPTIRALAFSNLTSFRTAGEFIDQNKKRERSIKSYALLLIIICYSLLFSLFF